MRPVWQHHLNDEKHPYAFRTGKGGILAFPDSNYRPGHDSGSRPPVRFTGYGWWIRRLF